MYNVFSTFWWLLHICSFEYLLKAQDIMTLSSQMDIGQWEVSKDKNCHKQLENFSTVFYFYI